MKRTVAAIMLVLFCLLPASASMQKTYQSDSIEYQMAYALCVSAGVLPPSSVNPTTGAEIASALHRIPAGRLGADEQRLLDQLLAELEWNPIIEADYFGMDPRAIISLDAFAQTTPLEHDRDFFVKYQDRLHAVDLSLDFDFAQVGYGFVDYVFLSPTLREGYDRYFGSNLDAFFINRSLLQVDGVLNAGILFGNEWMNFSIMSTEQSMGYGRTGNLVLGNNFDHQRYLRFHTFSKYFDYTLNLTHYSPMENGNSASPDDLSIVWGELFNGKQQEYIIHRFEVKLADKVQIALMETSMFYVENPLDIRILNPFLFLHGFNNYEDLPEPNDPDVPGSIDQANNLAALEIGYTFLPHHRINFQFMLDQFQLSSEPGSAPNALGFLLNYETSWIIDDTYLTGWAEAAYLMPAVYLNNKLGGDYAYNFNYDFIVGSQFYSLNGNHGQINYTGYGYGPDSIVMGIGATYGKLNSFKVDGAIIYSIHGRNGLGYENIIATRDPDDVDELFSVPLSKAEHRLELKVMGEYIPIEGLRLQGGAAFVQAWNYGCRVGNDLSDLQLYFGVSFDPVGMFAK